MKTLKIHLVNNWSYFALLIFLIASLNWVAVCCWIFVGISEHRELILKKENKKIEAYNDILKEEVLKAHRERDSWREKYIRLIFDQRQELRKRENSLIEISNN